MIIIECTNCHARYQYDEARFDGKASKKIKCAKCGTIFEIRNPALASTPVEPVAAAVAAPSAAPAQAPGERTFTRQPTRASAKPEETTEQAPLPEKSTGKVSGKPQLPTGKRLSLAIIDGADAGTVYRIEKPRFTIGRAGADLTLNDSEASRQHAQVEVRDAVVFLNDLNSTNGTLVDGSRIEESVELQDKSEFQIGGTTLMLIVTDDA